MLYVWNSDDEDNTLREFHVERKEERLAWWLEQHICSGYNVPCTTPQKKKIRFDSTLQVQADGHEKMEIESQLSGIPRSNNRTVTYSGDTARFVVDNLKL